MMQIHELKLASAYFDAVASGEKCFEVRRDDRGFQRGDRLKLRRYGEDVLTGRYGYLKGDANCHRTDADTIDAKITYILTGGQLGIEPGFVVMGISLLATDSTESMKKDDDLVSRLRERGNEGGSLQYFLMKEAADRIEELEFRAQQLADHRMH